jgi:hypothetical protein
LKVEMKLAETRRSRPGIRLRADDSSAAERLSRTLPEAIPQSRIGITT